MAEAGDDLQISMLRVIGAGQGYELELRRCHVNLRVALGVARIGVEREVQIFGG